MSTLTNMKQALEYGQSNNLRINSESMPFSFKNSNYSIVDRVSARINLATNPVNAKERDFFKYPWCATDYNPLSPFSIY